MKPQRSYRVFLHRLVIKQRRTRSERWLSRGNSAIRNTNRDPSNRVDMEEEGDTAATTMASDVKNSVEEDLAGSKAIEGASTVEVVSLETRR